MSRSDLLFTPAKDFEEMFLFGESGKDSLRPDDGVRVQEQIGYDFQSELAPVIAIKPSDISLETEASFDERPLDIHITIEDIGLNYRKEIFQKRIELIKETEYVPIDLLAMKEMAFFNGFIIRCFITLSSSDQSAKSEIWHRSQVIYSKEFVVKATTDDALFNISWVSFQEESEKKEVLFYVDWQSYEVSNMSDTQCFTIKANNDLKDSFRRLENNVQFGHFSVSLIFSSILNEIIYKCALHCDTSAAPAEGSLHQKLLPLMQQYDLDISDLNRDLNSEHVNEKSDSEISIFKMAQETAQIGSSLNIIKFGGFR